MRWPKPISLSPRASACRKPGFCLSGLADRIQHVEHRSRRAAMQRAFQRTDAGHRRRDQSGFGGRRNPCREGRGIEPMLANRSQIGVQRAAGGVGRRRRRIASSAYPRPGRRAGSGPSGCSPRRKRMMAGVSTTGAASSISAVSRSSPSGISAIPARRASTGDSDAIAARCGCSRRNSWSRAAPIAAASFCPFGISSKKPVEQQRGDRFRRAASRQLLDRLAANDQAAIGAVHIGQNGFGGNHIIETRHGFLPSQPVSMCGMPGSPSILINVINMSR